MGESKLAGRARHLALAAAEVLGEHGAAGLNHRAVDRHAGFSEGSTSNHFRTRSALVGAICRFLTEHDLETLERLRPRLRVAEGIDAASAADDLATLIGRWTRREPLLTKARLELFLIAARDPEVAAQLELTRSIFRARAEAMLDGLSPGAARHALFLLAIIEGLTANQLLHPEGRLSSPALKAGLVLVLQALAV